MDWLEPFDWGWLHLLALAVGFVYAVPVGHYFIERTLAQLRPSPHPTQVHAACVGLVERTLFLLMFLNGGATFVGVWIGLKVAGRWKAWTDMKEEDEGGRYFNTHLTGNLLSVLYAMAGAYLAHATRLDSFASAVHCAVALLIATGVFFSYARGARHRWYMPPPYQFDEQAWRDTYVSVQVVGFGGKATKRATPHPGPPPRPRAGRRRRWPWS